MLILAYGHFLTKFQLGLWCIGYNLLLALHTKWDFMRPCRNSRNFVNLRIQSTLLVHMHSNSALIEFVLLLWMLNCPNMPKLHLSDHKIDLWVISRVANSSPFYQEYIQSLLYVFHSIAWPIFQICEWRTNMLAWDAIFRKFCRNSQHWKCRPLPSLRISVKFVHKSRNGVKCITLFDSITNICRMLVCRLCIYALSSNGER